MAELADDAAVPLHGKHTRRPEVLRVRIDSTAAAHDLACELVWLRVLGPTATVLVQLLVRAAGRRDVWRPDALAAVVGVGMPVLWRAIDRLERFGVASLHDGLLTLRRYMPAPSDASTRRHLERGQRPR